MILNDAGKMIERVIIQIDKYYLNIEVNEFIVMPDHVHIIIKIVG